MSQCIVSQYCSLVHIESNSVTAQYVAILLHVTLCIFSCLPMSSCWAFESLLSIFWILVIQKRNSNYHCWANYSWKYLRLFQLKCVNQVCVVFFQLLYLFLTTQYVASNAHFTIHFHTVDWQQCMFNSFLLWWTFIIS